jgi:hypothetical protein
MEVKRLEAPKKAMLRGFTMGYRGLSLIFWIITALMIISLVSGFRFQGNLGIANSGI